MKKFPEKATEKNPKEKNLWAAVIVAAGQGSRMHGDTPKQYRKINIEAILACSVRQLLPFVDLIQIVIGKNHTQFYEKTYKEIIDKHKPAKEKILPPAIGGNTRQESVLCGLKALAGHAPKFVLIHDAARPFVAPPLIRTLTHTMQTHNTQAVVPTLPVSDSLCRSRDSNIIQYLNRDNVGRVQTPQAFLYAPILAAHENSNKNTYTDDASLAIAAGLKVATIPGDPQNIKITTQSDLNIQQTYEFRATTGVDAHAFGKGSAIKLGGITIPHSHGLIGHSDADVVLHALCDAMLAAAAENDIGHFFPPSDPQWKDTDSAIFIQTANKILQQNNIAVSFADITIIAETPKIAPHHKAMTENIAKLLNIAPSRVALKATTTDRLGFIGRGEGIAAIVNLSTKIPILPHA